MLRRLNLRERLKITGNPKVGAAAEHLAVQLTPVSTPRSASSPNIFGGPSGGDSPLAPAPEGPQGLAESPLAPLHTPGMPAGLSPTHGTLQGDMDRSAQAGVTAPAGRPWGGSHLLPTAAGRAQSSEFKSHAEEDHGSPMGSEIAAMAPVNGQPPSGPR